MANNSNVTGADNPLFWLAVIIGSILVLIFGFREPKPRLCAKSYCDTKADDNSNYCFVHNPDSEYNAKCREILRSNAYKEDDCYAPGCSNPRPDGRAYCARHECAALDCGNAKETGSNYCIHHVCSVMNCNGRIVSSATGLCREHTDAYSHTASHQSQVHQNSSHRVEWPDCDDYEDYDEFMDDWDGNMPDGSDAEDYWEDW